MKGVDHGLKGVDQGLKGMDQGVGEVDHGVEEVHARGYIFADDATLGFLHWFLIKDCTFVRDMSDPG